MKAPKVIKFRQTSNKATPDDTKIVEEGTIGSLKYEVHQRNSSFAVVHIFNSKRTMIFKKDASIFEDMLQAMKFSEMVEGDVLVMKGSGDNDDLVFTFENGELSVSLKRRGFSVLEKLQDILKNHGSKKHKGGSSV